MDNKRKIKKGDIAKKLLVSGDIKRLDILCCVFSKKKVCVSDIAKNVRASVATTSHHLQVLSKEGILEPVREGKRICYELSKAPFARDLKNLICKYKQS